MTLKEDGRQRESKLKKRHKMVKCDSCGFKNDYDEMLENDDVDRIGNDEFLYCEQCGNQIQVK